MGESRRGETVSVVVRTRGRGREVAVLRGGRWPMSGCLGWLDTIGDDAECMKRVPADDVPDEVSQKGPSTLASESDWIVTGAN